MSDEKIEQARRERALEWVRSDRSDLLSEDFDFLFDLKTTHEEIEVLAFLAGHRSRDAEIAERDATITKQEKEIESITLQWANANKVISQLAVTIDEYL